MNNAIITRKKIREHVIQGIMKFLRNTMRPIESTDLITDDYQVENMKAVIHHFVASTKLGISEIPKKNKIFTVRKAVDFITKQIHKK